VRRDAQQPDAELVRRLDVVHRPDPGEDQARDRRVPRRLAGGGDQLALVNEAAAVGERRAAEAVAVGDLDHGDASGVHAGDHRCDLLRGELVRDRVGAVAQRTCR
jgi:hypothetical protein